MSLDRKSTGLKLLQGLIWDEGYRSGALRSHVFPDVPPALEAWARSGVRLRVFSSGSVQAQKLLFGHTQYGDLTPLFEGFHDTTTGPKQEPASYLAITRAFALPPPAILFLSDVRGELDAAARGRPAHRSAGAPRQPPRGAGGAPGACELQRAGVSVSRSSAPFSTASWLNSIGRYSWFFQSGIWSSRWRWNSRPFWPVLLTQRAARGRRGRRSAAARCRTRARGAAEGGGGRARP